MYHLRMAYSFTPGEPVGDGVQRIAHCEIEKLVADLEHPAARGPEESVHDARRRCKKLRALARLVRPTLGDLYGPSNRSFRDAARELSAARNAHVAVATLDELVSEVGDEGCIEDMSGMRAALVEMGDQATAQLAEASESRERALDLVHHGAGLVERWQIPDGFGSLQGGLRRTYERLVADWELCCAEPTAETFHEWRKRVKYHRHHLDLLRLASPGLADAHRSQAHDLSDLLGKDHDIVDLVRTVAGDRGSFAQEGPRRQLLLMAHRRSQELRGAAIALGAQITSEPPDALVQRWASAWSSWRILEDDPSHRQRELWS